VVVACCGAWTVAFRRRKPPDCSRRFGVVREGMENGMDPTVVATGLAG
jgi:hypothetical protein